MTVHEHRLIGCRPEPLGSYLKALGLLRLVAEQADPEATGHWAADGFVLWTVLDDDALEGFFLDEYAPTPLLSPWNNSSGFGKEGIGELHEIESSQTPRLEPYRRATQAARAILDRSAQDGWSKEQVVAACRSELPDACVAWVDAAVVLTSDRSVYPPLLGTGGNDGRLEFSRNFHQRVLDVLGLSKPGAKYRRQWWQDAVFAVGAAAGQRGQSAGQFDPGASGGANSAALGAADKVLNPWDWVLLLEGSLLLASGSARRLAGTTGGRAAAPFTVDAAAGGYATATPQETSRGEFWAPLWVRPVTLPELRRLFAEGRADWRDGHVRSGLDLAKAAASLGVERGIAAFSRHAFVERFGLSTVAVSAGRIEVRQRPAVAPLGELDGWLDRVRRGSNPPAAVATGVRSVDRAAFDVATGGTAEQVRRLLVEVAALEKAVGTATGFHERAAIGPVTGLAAGRWLPLLAAGATAELRVAVGLASGRDAVGSPVSALRLLLRPMHMDRYARATWTEAAPLVPGLGSRSFPVVLADAHARRSVQRLSEQRATEQTEQVGVQTAFADSRSVPLADVAVLVAGELDEARLADDLAACLLLDWGGSVRLPPTPEQWCWPSPSLAVLGPFFSTAASEPTLVPESSWPAQLAADRVEPVVTAALHRWRIAGRAPVLALPGPSTPGEGPRLGAALLCRLSSADRRRLVETVVPELDPQRTTPPAGDPPATDLDSEPDLGEAHA